MKGFDGMGKKERLAFVVHRYGQGINGGAEEHCRLLAEYLSDLTRGITIMNQERPILMELLSLGFV